MATKCRPVTMTTFAPDLRAFCRADSEAGKIVFLASIKCRPDQGRLPDSSCSDSPDFGM